MLFLGQVMVAVVVIATLWSQLRWRAMGVPCQGCWRWTRFSPWSCCGEPRGRD